MRRSSLVFLMILTAGLVTANATPKSVAVGAGINFGQHPGIVLKLPDSPTFVDLYYSIPQPGDGIDIKVYSYLVDVQLGKLFSLNLSPSFEFISSPLFTSSPVYYGGLVGAGLRLGISIWPLASLEIALSIGFEPTVTFSAQPGVPGSSEFLAGYMVPMQATLRYYLGD